MTNILKTDERGADRKPLQALERGVGNRTTAEGDDLRHKGERRTRYADLYDFAPFGYLTLNEEGTIRGANVTGAHMLGVERDALVGMSFWSFLTAGSSDLVRLCLARSLDTDTGEKCDAVITKADGTIFHALLEARKSLPDPEEKEALWWCVMTDITERKQTEEALRAAHDFNRSLFLASVDPFTTLDSEAKITDANPAFEALTGLRRAELIGMDWAGYFTEPAKALRSHKMVMEGTPVKDYPLTVRHRLGSFTPVLLNAAPYHDGEGHVAGVFAAAHDVSERRRVEGEKAQLVAAVEQTDENVVVTDRRWRISYVNSAFERKTGYARHEVTGKSIALLGSKTGKNIFVHPIRAALKRGLVWKGQRTVRKKDGSTFEVEVSMSPFCEESGAIEGYVAVARDITGQLKLEEQLREAQKMEAIGTLAGGIAHDFNNVLAGILGFAEMALDEAPEDSTLAKNLRYVVKGAFRGRDLVKQILTFSRRNSYEKKLLGAAPLVKETIRLLRASLPSSVEIRFTMASASDLVFADPSQIRQILVNLATNGVHAIGENGGVLEIGLKDCEVGPDAMPEPGMEAGEYLELAVRDNGSGMTPETMSRIFEPFFTTKTAARGTGLGLAVVFGIVKDLHGAIHVDSEPGLGSTFRVFLPKGKPEMEQERFVSAPTLRGDERILFVDDEENIAEWAKAALERFGYRVTAVSDSMEALDIFLRSPFGFDLVITDQTMPRMSGKQLSREILKVRPHIPVILCTGYSDSASQADAGREGIRELLMKPISKKELAEAIRGVFDGKTEPP